MTEPIRLRDTPDKSSALDLAKVSSASHTYGVEHGAALFSAAIANPARATSAAKLGLVKIGLATMAVVLVVGLILLALPHARPAARTSDAPLAPPSVATEAPALPTVTTIVTATPVELASSSPIPTAPPHVIAAAHSAVVPASNLAEETRSLAAIRRLSGSDATLALSMIDTANDRFSTGIFREEREAIAVGALARLGRSSEAKARGEKFVATYPKSSFLDQVRRNSGL